jgi:hypothetical protein
MITPYCPRCHKVGRKVNFLGSTETFKHASRDADGAFRVCDPCKVYWWVSPQFWDFMHLEPKDQVRHNTQLIRAEYALVDGCDAAPEASDNDGNFIGEVVPF